MPGNPNHSGMKQNHWLLMTALIIAGCHGQMNRQDLSSISWLPIDSVFTYRVEKDGDHIFKSGDLLGLELIGGIEKKSHQFIPVVQLDSAYVALVTKIAKGLLDKSLDKKIRKNSEGYIKADFGRFFPNQQLVITAYLKENLAKGDLDTLEKYIRNMPEISEQFYISKEEAKRKFIAAGNGDFSSVLDKNPLPASIELTVREDYCTIEALTRLKEKLEGQAPYIISDVVLPGQIHPELRKVNTQDCIFHFKT